MATELTAAILAQTEYAEWERLVAESPNGSIYSLPAYLDALCTAGGGRFQVLGVRRGSELAGGVALYERDSRSGPYVMPRLLLYYNGVVLRRYDTKYPSERTGRQLKILATLEAALRTRGYGNLNLRSRVLTDVRPFLVAGWHPIPSYSYVVSLADIPGAWTRVEQNLRRLIERCRSEKLSVTEDDDFDGFFRLHTATLERRDVASYLPAAPFRTYFDTLRKANLARLFQARLADGRPVATQLVLLGAHPVCHTVSAAADPEFNKLGVSAFLRWTVFERLAAMGYAGNDLTDASLNPVTHFKSQLGGELELTLVLQSAESLRWKVGLTVGKAYSRARGAAGAVARKVLGRG